MNAGVGDGPLSGPRQAQRGAGDRRVEGEPLQLQPLDTPRAAEADDQRGGRRQQQRQREHVGDADEVAHEVGRRTLRAERVRQRDLAERPRVERGSKPREHHAGGAQPGDRPPAARHEPAVGEQQQQGGRRAEQRYEREPVAQPGHPLVGGERARLGIAAGEQPDREPEAEREQRPADRVGGHARRHDRTCRRRAEDQQRELDVGDEIERVAPVERRVDRGGGQHRGDREDPEQEREPPLHVASPSA